MADEYIRKADAVEETLKYIIEFWDKPEVINGIELYRCKQVPWWSVTKDPLMLLTPYTEPDIGAIRAEGYAGGFDDGYKAGLNDASLKKEDQEFKIGDEVESEVSGLRAYIIDINTCDETPWDFHCITKDFVSCYFLSKKNLRKTGNNIPELAEITRKIQEG